MIQTVIFDMDGVIVDTEPVHHYAYNQHFKQLNITVTPEMYASFTGFSTKNTFEKLKEHFDIKEDIPTLMKPNAHFLTMLLIKKKIYFY